MKWRRAQVDPKSSPVLARSWMDLCALHWPERTLEFNVKDHPSVHDSEFIHRKIKKLSQLPQSEKE